MNLEVIKILLLAILQFAIALQSLPSGVFKASSAELKLLRSRAPEGSDITILNSKSELATLLSELEDKSLVKAEVLVNEDDLIFIPGDLKSETFVRTPVLHANPIEIKGLQGISYLLLYGTSSSENPGKTSLGDLLQAKEKTLTLKLRRFSSLNETVADELYGKFEIAVLLGNDVEPKLDKEVFFEAVFPDVQAGNHKVSNLSDAPSLWAIMLSVALFLSGVATCIYAFYRHFLKS